MAVPLTQREFKRILLIKPSSTGDVVQALPILDGLRRRYPSAYIAWLVANPFVNLVEDHPALDEIIPFDRKRFGRLGRNLTVSIDFVRYVLSLRRRGFDLVVDLQGLFRSGFFARVTGAATRIGPANGREVAWIFYTHRYPVETMESHSIDRMWAAADLLGFGQDAMTFRLPITDADRAAARRLLVESGVDPDRDYAVVFPGARWETKVWPAERFAAVIDRLADEAGLPAVLAGSGSQFETCDRVSTAARRGAPNLAGKTTLREVSALIERAAAVITNDSGPMHVTDALGRPLVALFGPTNPVRTGPYHQPEAVVRVDLPCSPCYLKRLDRCPHQHACSVDLSVERVVDAAMAALRRTEKT